MDMDTWPRHADGRPKKIGEMTREEKLREGRKALAALKAEFEHPAHQAALAKALRDLR